MADYLVILMKLQILANKYKIPLIEDAAHAVGATYKKKTIGSISDFTMFSFQAIKHITTGDGGMLCFKNKKLIDKAKRIRWFGISREEKQKGIWENDISEIGYKYQMTDLGASLGYTALKEFNKLLKHRQKIFKIYKDILSKNSNIFCVDKDDGDRTHASWLFTIISEEKDKIQKKLREKKLSQTKYISEMISIRYLKKFIKGKSFPNMDYVEDKYLVLPNHHKITEKKAKYIAQTIDNLL